MKQQDQLKAIADICLSIDRKAETIYQLLMNRAPTEELRAFWQHMRDEEAEHGQFWVALNQAIDDGKIPMVFDNPGEVYFELLDIDRQADRFIASQPENMSVGGAFRAAYKMEFFLLHPSFEVLFQLAEERAGIPSPHDDYQEHIQEFLKAFTKYGGTDLSLELAGDFLIHLWKENRRAARRLLELHGLRSVVPACAGCGKIRDKEGNWIGSDEFIRRALNSDITHGVCPDCMKELYPGVPQPEKS